MYQENLDVYRSDDARRVEQSGVDGGLRAVLWTLWTLAVAGTVFYNWRADIVAGRPLNLLGILVYSILTGVVGLLIITLIELRVNPRRFLD